MKGLLEMVKHRTSIRAFRSDAFWKADKDAVLAYAAQAESPYGLPAEWAILDPKEHGLNSPVISGSVVWLAGKMRRAPHAEEAFGFLFEDIILFADAKGIGTTIIAGTMNRSAFEKAMRVGPDEILPCATPLGYPAAKRGMKELVMRKAIGADKRISIPDFVFEKSFEKPINLQETGELSDVFELVRWAPSAVNKQPWRLVLEDHKMHFYKKTSKGYKDPDTGWDIQKIDIGIAMKHFDLGMKKLGYQPELQLKDPGITVPADTEYISTFCY